MKATNGKEGGVCIGYDHRANKSRALRSERFAKLAAAVLVHRGIPVKLYAQEVATPLVPYCVEQLGCSAGVMVTASHNPPADNGYKVYWSNGAQIISPHDKGIAEHIEKELEPWTTYEPDSILSHPLCEDVTEAMIQGYFTDMKSKLCQHEAENGDEGSRDLKMVYSAMHGVGGKYTQQAFENFGLPPYIATESQQRPDPDFPTVEFPNPEEGKGALALAMETAAAEGANLFLANDPVQP